MCESSQSKLSKPRRKCGFTLIELLAVMAVITILAGMVFGVASFANRKSADAACIAELEGWRNLLEDFNAEHGYYPEGHSSGSVASLTNFYADATFANFYVSAEREVDFKDPWDSEYQYQRKSRFRYLIGSKGKDQRFGNNSGSTAEFGKFDDITNENGRMN